MKSFRWVLCIGLVTNAALTASTPLDPRGRIHIPIGVPNTLDSLKTFVEAEGNFSPGFGTYGVYFWVWNNATRQLYAPTMATIPCEHGLPSGGALVPWSRWSAGDVEVTTTVCATTQTSPTGEIFVDGARVSLTNRSSAEATISLYAAVRPLGAAGGPIRTLVADEDALRVDGHVALWSERRADRAFALPADEIGSIALSNAVPNNSRLAMNMDGACSGALVFDVKLPAGHGTRLQFICPVLPGRRAIGHRWDGVSSWAQLDLNKPNPPQGGLLQPDPGDGYWHNVSADHLFSRAAASLSSVKIDVPDQRWSDAFHAIAAHSALCMNEGAPDVAVVNYNVFNRDGMYMANIYDKAGMPHLATAAIDYFLAHPFNGRTQPEADNPGQILWAMGEHWLFGRDTNWLRRVYPSTRKLAAMIRYCRATSGPHWVSDRGLDFGENLLPKDRKELKPGACDGFHPEYTEAYDIAGLRYAAMLAEAAGDNDGSAYRKLADDLFDLYEKKFGSDLAKGYGSYAVLWPCRLYPLGQGLGWEQFKSFGAQKPTSWRYFPLARAHQGLLAGNRSAGHETLSVHLAHEQMRGWYAFDEGGPSGPGGWQHVLSNWKVRAAGDGNSAAWTVAMPHGWANAEFVLLLRDSVVCEDGNRLILFAGVPPEWLTHKRGIRFELPTHFGLARCSLFETSDGSRVLTIGEAAEKQIRPLKAEIVVRLPEQFKWHTAVDGKWITPNVNGELVLPAGTTRCYLFSDPPAR